MCKVGLAVLAVQFVSNHAIFEVVKEQIKGDTMPDGYEKDTAFID